MTKPIDLRQHIVVPETMKNGLVKCRVSYRESIEQIDYEPYVNRDIQSLKCVYDNAVSFDYKYKKRKHLESLFKQKGNADEIIIIKSDLVTDAFYYNLAFYDGTKWFTPKTPLLLGVRRAQLLFKRKLQLLDIRTVDFNKFTDVSLINALTPLGKIKLSVNKIKL